MENISSRPAAGNEDESKGGAISNLLLLMGSIFLAGIAFWAPVHGIRKEFLVPTSAITNEKGVAYKTALPEPRYWFSKNLSDTPGGPDESKTELFENYKPLGPAHSVHDAIRNVGAGQFSHWGSTLYFSTSDNSDPRTNGRRYVVVMTAVAPKWLSTPCLLISSCLLGMLVLRLARRRSVPPEVVNRKVHWRYGVHAALAMSLLSLYPQIDLWIARGVDWQGSYASLNYDEEIYAAYINGLILGRQRRTEPLEIPDPTRPPHESIFSIQVVPPYLILFLNRIFGLTVAQAFIWLTPLTAFLATLMIFYLIASATRDEALAAVGALAVLICGTLAARHSAANQFFGWTWYGSFLFLRRYEPTVIFPAFFGFIALTWQAFTGQGRRAWCAAIAAGAVFAVIIFSYFFLWTAAAAWLACFVLLWLVARRGEWPLLVRRLAPTVLLAAPTFAVYAIMVGRRDRAIDKVAAVVSTHAPDFYRVPEWIAAIVILLIIWGVTKRRVDWRQPVALFTGSLALMPLAVFNQQIITGRSLQPQHYEMFSANYLSLLALILTLVILRRGRGLHFEGYVPEWLIALLACAVIGWGVFEIRSVTSAFEERNIDRDLFVPVAKRLANLAAAHGKGPNDREVVFSPDILVVSDNVAAFAPQTPFWGSYVPIASGLSWEEQQERYFQYLYYSAVSPDRLFLDLQNNEMLAVAAAFGYERYNPALVTNFKPITTIEIRDKVRQYSEYAATFDRERARHPEISYLVGYTDLPFDFTNLSRWYTSVSGERIGPFTIFRVKLRDAPQ
ncbi:MAG TPA: hypothetical protein VGL11_15570 [Candidatus Binatia bacterium]